MFFDEADNQQPNQKFVVNPFTKKKYEYSERTKKIVKILEDRYKKLGDKITPDIDKVFSVAEDVKDFIKDVGKKTKIKKLKKVEKYIDKLLKKKEKSLDQLQVASEQIEWKIKNSDLKNDFLDEYKAYIDLSEKILKGAGVDEEFIEADQKIEALLNKVDKITQSKQLSKKSEIQFSSSKNQSFQLATFFDSKIINVKTETAAAFANPFNGDHAVKSDVLKEQKSMRKRVKQVSSTYTKFLQSKDYWENTAKRKLGQLPYEHPYRMQYRAYVARANLLFDEMGEASTDYIRSHSEISPYVKKFKQYEYLTKEVAMFLKGIPKFK